MPSRRPAKGQLSFPFFKKKNGSESEPQPVSPQAEPVSDSVDGNDSSDFEKRFHSFTRRDWRIRWTNNRSTMISFRSDRRSPELRLHAMFRQAPDKLVRDIADRVEGRRTIWSARVNTFIRDRIEDARRRAHPRRREALKAEGRVYDLNPMFDALNRMYFQGAIRAELGWSRPKKKMPKIPRLGSYSVEDGRIRLHPVLDQIGVPRFVVESILFHEMAHVAVPSRMVRGRRISHGKAFKEKMQEFPRLEEAEDWLYRNLGRMLRKRSWRRPGNSS